MQCYLCSEKFPSKEDAITHLENDHDIQREEKDFGTSSSDEFDEKDSDDESETEEDSSGVDEKDEQSDGGVEEDDDDNDSNINLSGRHSNVEPQESQNARHLVQGYLESLRHDPKLSSKIIDLTQNL